MSKSISPRFSLSCRWGAINRSTGSPLYDKVLASGDEIRVFVPLGLLNLLVFIYYQERMIRMKGGRQLPTAISRHNQWQLQYPAMLLDVDWMPNPTLRVVPIDLNSRWQSSVKMGKGIQTEPFWWAGPWEGEVQAACERLRGPNGCCWLLILSVSSFNPKSQCCNATGSIAELVCGQARSILMCQGSVPKGSADTTSIYRDLHSIW
jgi:hypothetical protein